MLNRLSGLVTYLGRMDTHSHKHTHTPPHPDGDHTPIYITHIIITQSIASSPDMYKRYTFIILLLLDDIVPCFFSCIQKSKHVDHAETYTNPKRYYQY